MSKKGKMESCLFVEIKKLRLRVGKLEAAGLVRDGLQASTAGYVRDIAARSEPASPWQPMSGPVFPKEGEWVVGRYSRLFAMVYDIYKRVGDHWHKKQSSGDIGLRLADMVPDMEWMSIE